ncbi:MAG: hypothetical protein R2762_15060 [Bryobacteraceae bacterium]
MSDCCEDERPQPAAAARMAGRVGVSMLVKAVGVLSSLCFIGVTTRAFTKQEVAVLAVSAILASIMEVSKGLGLGPLMMKRLPGLMGTGDPEAGALITSCLFYSLIPPAILAALGAMAAPVLSRYWFGSEIYQGELRLGLAAGLAMVATNTNLTVLMTAREFTAWAALSSSASLLQRMAPCALLLLPVSLWHFLLAVLAFSTAALAPALFPIGGLLRRNGLHCMPVAAFWNQSRHYYGSAILRFLAVQADQLLVVALCEPESLAVYYVLRRLYSIAVMTMDSFFDARLPELSKRASEDAAGARAQLNGWIRLTLYGGTIGGAALAANGPRLVDAVAGAGYSDSRLLLVVFAGSAVTFFLLELTQLDILLFGKAQSRFAVSASSAGVGGMSGAILGALWGPAGLAAGAMSGQVAGLLTAARAGSGALRLRHLLLGLGVIAAAGLLPGWKGPALPWLPLALGNGLIVAFGWIHYSRWQVEESLRRAHT